MTGAEGRAGDQPRPPRNAKTASKRPANACDLSGLAPAIKKRAASIPRLYQAEYLRVVTGSTVSRRSAIRQQCLECVGYERVAITECPAIACPLYRFRPYQPRASSAPADDGSQTFPEGS